MNRVGYSPFGSMQKDSRRILFPYLLDMSSFCAPLGRSRANRLSDLPPKKYELRAVVEHMGVVNNGHFVTYRRIAETSDWVCASDESVYNVDIKRVAKAEAYLLFYEACDD